MAQAFSSVLDSAFSLDSDVDQISQNIDQKKQQMLMQNRELEALQAKIRETENRLKASESTPAEESSPSGRGGKREPQYGSTGEDGYYDRVLF
ncbi:hypothetical protein PHISP_02992 [Aspergillus sp. HF37]|nr:hypothetical protein PHISP_02992 [Aspergillus sp. HF37]